MKTISELTNVSGKEQNIIEQIEIFKKKWKAEFKECYIGRTNDVSGRLFAGLLHEHASVKGEYKYQKGDPYFSACAGNSENAIKIEKYFQDLGMQGLDGSVTRVEEGNFVYCFIDRRTATPRILKMITKQQSELE